jgi:hypothetical protein
MSEGFCQVPDNRHCEERRRRSNPVLSFAGFWIASLSLAMTVKPILKCVRIVGTAQTRRNRRAPDAAQHEVLRCRSGVHGVGFLWVRAQRCIAECAAPASGTLTRTST